MEQIIEVNMINEVLFQLTHLNKGSAMELKEYLSCFVENYFFSPKYKAKIWDGKVSFYDWNNQTIPIGLFPQFIKFCKTFGYEYKLNFPREDLVNEILDDEFEIFYDAIFKDSSFSPRDYQDDAIKKALRLKRGVIESPTGSGKSLIIYSILRFILGSSDGKILLIVPNISLVNQMFNDFKDYGWEYCESNCSLIFNKSKNVNKEARIIISTFQSAVKFKQDLFDEINAVIVDETHLASNLSIQSCLKKCVNADYRIGMTGTLPEQLINQFAIYGYLGPKIYGISSSELIDMGVLSKIRIANLLIEYPKDTVYQYWHDEDGTIKQNTYQEEIDIIYRNSDRNKIFNFIIKNLDKTQNILILCHKISHLKDIKKYLEENLKDYKIYEIYGKTDADEREKIRQITNVQESTIILGTFATVGTGINIKRLHHVMFASSYRSKIKILQSIGRGLRTHETKDRLIVWDINDDLSWLHLWGDKEILHVNHVYKHWIERLRYYDTQGFKYITKKINISNISF